MSQTEILQRLQRAQRLIATLTQHLHKAEAVRDTCIRQMSDNDGAHDRRVVAVR